MDFILLLRLEAIVINFIEHCLEICNVVILHIKISRGTYAADAKGRIANNKH